MSTMFGQLLESVQRTREVARDRAIADLWGRNRLNPNAAGYKIAETVTMHQDGREVVEYRLYKLVDVSVTTIKAEVTHSVEVGTDKAVEMKSWPDRQKKEDIDG